MYGDNPQTLTVLRRGWKCDCDGESHRGLGVEPHPAHGALQSMRKAIGDYTGTEPETCPWRAMYDPLVGEAIKIAHLADNGLGAHALDEDAPAIWIDAVRVYLTARNATRAKDDKDRLERERKKRR